MADVLDLSVYCYHFFESVAMGVDGNDEEFVITFDQFLQLGKVEFLTIRIGLKSTNEGKNRPKTTRSKPLQATT